MNSRAGKRRGLSVTAWVTGALIVSLAVAAIWLIHTRDDLTTLTFKARLRLWQIHLTMDEYWAIRGEIDMRGSGRRFFNRPSVPCF
jgi:hypothetical protein